jgi:hypothetical protein
MELIDVPCEGSCRTHQDGGGTPDTLADGFERFCVRDIRWRRMRPVQKAGQKRDDGQDAGKIKLVTIWRISVDPSRCETYR